jgi:RND family efflux transporter MFP subunit
LKSRFRVCFWSISSLCILLGLTSCHKAVTAAPAPQALPVQTMTVASAPVPQSDEYVATIKSRRSATLNPQVDGNLTQILVHSGDRVVRGQVLMVIDPAKQEATVASQVGTERQKLAVYKYNQTEVDRQRASRVSQEKQLDYYKIRAPFDGIVGDIPVRMGDYVSATTLLTTVDENQDLEAYIYIPTERAAQVRSGLGVDILDNSGQLLEHTSIDFVSPQVDNQLQGILAKASVHSPQVMLRTAQLVKARVIWKTSPIPVVPVLAVTRLGGQTFVYVAQNKDGKFFAHQLAIELGDPVGNNYAVLGGLQNGDRVIVSGTQFLVDGMPVQPLG